MDRELQGTNVGGTHHQHHEDENHSDGKNSDEFKRKLELEKEILSNFLQSIISETDNSPFGDETQVVNGAGTAGPVSNMLLEMGLCPPQPRVSDEDESMCDKKIGL